MRLTDRTSRARASRPSLLTLEGRELLTGVAPHAAHVLKAVAAQVGSTAATGHIAASAAHATATATVKIINTVTAGGYRFVNFDGPNAVPAQGDDTFVNGVSNKGVAIGRISNAAGGTPSTPVIFMGDISNSRSGAVTILPSTLVTGTRAINSAGVIVGSQPVAGSQSKSAQAFFLYNNKVKTIGGSDWLTSSANGINDANVIVGQYRTSAGRFGFARLANGTILSIHAPASAGPKSVVYASGVNNNGLIVGYYTDADFHKHAFTASLKSAKNGVITLTPVADPVMPANPIVPDAVLTSVQLTAVNDRGIAVGYFGDNALSFYGFLYNTHTGKYTFLSDPSADFGATGQGVTTYITGITNSNAIVGAYSDVNYSFHGFVARKV